MGFHEKGAWACLIAIAVIYLPYFFTAFRSPSAALGLFWMATLAMVVMVVVFHTVNAAVSKSARDGSDISLADELDQKIERVAAKWAGTFLGAIVLLWVIAAMYSLLQLVQHVTASAGASDDSEKVLISVSFTSAMAYVQLLFAGFVLANFVYYVAIVVGYRRLNYA